MTTEHFDVAIVGLGALGSATAYQTAVKGARVIGFEQYDFGNVYGASHDTSRIVRTSYGAPEYVALAQAAYKDWAELENRSGVQMLTITGGVVFFAHSKDDIPATNEGDASKFYETMKAPPFIKSLDANKIPYELLSPEEVNQRWPGFDVPPGVVTIYTADSGVVHASRSVSTMQHQARAHGAVLKEHTRVDRVTPGVDGAEVLIETSLGRYRAAKVILAADAWINKLLNPLGYNIPLRVMQEQVAYFKPKDPSLFEESKFPVWIWTGDTEHHFYGFPSYGEPTIKAGRDTSNNLMTPEQRTFVPSEKLSSELASFMSRLIPSKGQPLRTVTCQYAITPDRQFIISPLDKHPNIIIGLGGGHAFKFAPAIGRVLAELALDGKTKEDISMFSMPRTSPPSKL